MQVAILSTHRLAGGTTLTGVLGTYLAAEHNYKTLMTHTFHKDTSMERYILSDMERNAYNDDVYESNISALMRLIKNGKLTAEDVQNYSFSLLPHSNLDLIFDNTIYDFTKSFGASFQYLMHRAKSVYDIVIIDIPLEWENEHIFEIVDQSEVVILCTTQHQYGNYEFIAKYTERIKSGKKPLHNVLLCVNQYQEKVKYAKRQLAEVYKDIIQGKNEVTIMPYFIDIVNACNNSQLIDYTLRNMQQEKNDELRKMMNGLRQMHEYISKKQEMEV